MIIKTIYIDNNKGSIKIWNIKENQDEVENSLSEAIEKLIIKKLVD